MCIFWANGEQKLGMIPLGLAQKLETMDEMESESGCVSVRSIQMEYNECSGKYC